LRELAGAAAHEGGRRAIAQPLVIAVGQAAYPGEYHYSPGHRRGAPGGTRSQPVAARRPQGQMATGRMPGQQRRSICDHIRARRLPDQRRRPVHRGGHILEGPWPAATRLPRAPELGHAHGVTGCRQRSGHRPGVRTVISRPPEAAVEEYHERGWRRHGPGPPWGEPNVRDVLRAGAIPDHQIRGRRPPGENIIGRRPRGTLHRSSVLCADLS
jgi:hypothetical protein